MFSGFGGVACRIADLLADEYSSKSLVSLAVSPPSLPEYTFNSCGSRLANSLLTLAGLANSSSCFLGRNVVMAGKVVALLEGVASAEACCQECRLFQTGGGGAGCNVWNYCDAPGGCRCALCQAAPAA